MDLEFIEGLDRKKKLTYLKRLEIRDTIIEFATKHHRNMEGEPMDWEDFFHIAELYEETILDQEVVIVGAAQIGKTDWLVITVLAAAYNGLNVLYVCSTAEMRDKYVAEKVKRPISRSDFYSAVVKDSDSNSKKQLEFGKGLIRFVGGVSENEFKSYSADLVVIDETDEIDNEYNINQSFSRLRGSKH